MAINIGQPVAFVPIQGNAIEVRQAACGIVIIGRHGGRPSIGSSPIILRGRIPCFRRDRRW